ncbi:MAG: hypothetical protein ABWZ03_00040, partial [Solirubrobacterales bacterium]
MDDRPHRILAVEDQRRMPVGGRGRQRRRLPIDIDPIVAGLRPPKGQLDRGVAKRGRDQIAPPFVIREAGEPACQAHEAVRDMDAPSEEADQEADAKRGKSESDDPHRRLDGRGVGPEPAQAESD